MLNSYTAGTEATGGMEATMHVKSAFGIDAVSTVDLLVHALEVS